MRHVYGAMERSLDASSSPAVAPLWSTFGQSLRREPSLAQDLADVAGADSADLPPSPATLEYMMAIEEAAGADAADGGGRLIGHLYCRRVLSQRY